MVHGGKPGRSGPERPRPARPRCGRFFRTAAPAHMRARAGRRPRPVLMQENRATRDLLDQWRATVLRGYHCIRHFHKRGPPTKKRNAAAGGAGRDHCVIESYRRETLGESLPGDIAARAIPMIRPPPHRCTKPRAILRGRPGLEGGKRLTQKGDTR